MKPRILLVDDEKLNLLTFEAFLAGDGYELHMAEDGRRAIDLARELLPDLILLDVMMPRLDGFSVCRTIRSDPVIGRVPIIIVTALHDSASRLEGLHAGADDFLTKPCARDEIRARVRTVVSLNRFRTIAQERARFERLYEFAPVGIVLADANGVVAAANPRAEAMLKHSSGRGLVGDVIGGRFAPTAGAIIGKVLDTALAGATLPPQEVRRRVDETDQVFQVHGTAVPDSGVRRAMLMFTDATAEAEARDALKQLNHELDDLVRARTQQLEEANGLLLSYASFVSHDLRSPLTVMKGYLSMIAEGVVPVAEAGPMITAAYKATIMMQELVQNILQLAHDEHAGAAAGPSEAIDPTPIVQRVWTHVEATFPHDGRRCVQIGLEPVNANALIVERVMYNLLTNAAKYSAQRNEPLIEIGTVETPKGLAIFVRDNGVGFDSRDADKLFREFSRLGEMPKGGGLGLGLSLVARLVRAHGGDIWAEGRLGEGATFYVRFGSASDVPPLTRESVAAV